MIETWLGLDPGSANFGVSVVQYDTITTERKVLYATLLATPIKNLTANVVTDKHRRGKPSLKRDEASFKVAMHLFSDEIDWIFKTFGITHLAIERFQARGVSRGDQGELVSVMIGIICYKAFRRKIKFWTTIAGVWKSAIARLHIDLLSLYKDGKIQFKLEPHVIDAALIALWHANKETVWDENLNQLLVAISNAWHDANE